MRLPRSLRRSFDAVYGFLVYGMLLAPEFARYPGVFRSNEAGQAYLPLMFGGLLIAIAGGRLHLREGLRRRQRRGAKGCGSALLLGLFVVLAFASVNYATLNIGRQLAAMTAAAGFVEWLVVGDDHRAGLQAGAEIGALAPARYD